jgi:Holliday junction resolvase
MTNSRDKGVRGELEFARICREHGYDEARRGQQHRGGGDSPDVVGVPGFHFECKWTEHFRLHAAVDQAVNDSAGTGRVPIVAYKANRRGLLMVLRAEDFFNLIEHQRGLPI